MIIYQGMETTYWGISKPRPDKPMFPEWPKPKKPKPSDEKPQEDEDEEK